MNTSSARFLAVIGQPDADDLLMETRLVREAAVSRYTEVDLLVAALHEHIADLKSERDHLRAEVMDLRAQLAAAEHRAGAHWLATRQKPPRAR